MENTTAQSTAVSSPAATPEGVRQGDERLVRLTEAAGRKVAALITREAQGDYLRVAIAGGGCNGLSYKLRFASEPRRGDILVNSAGVRVSSWACLFGLTAFRS